MELIRAEALDSLSREIRAIYNADSKKAEVLIESLLEEKLREQPQIDRLSLLEGLENTFAAGATGTGGRRTGIEDKETLRLFSLLLGKDIPIEHIPADELMGKLSRSLNTVFDSLNQIIRVINQSLLGEKIEFETIRHVIGSDIENTEGHESIQDYLDQIQEAFLVAHRAFQLAAGEKFGQVLGELDPEKIAESTDQGLKFGPLRKAGNFDVYVSKFQACRKWFESGRYGEELMKEFEKTCQKLYKKKTRST